MRVDITVFSIILTLATYLASRYLAGKYPSPFTTPVFLSTTVIIIVLLACGIGTADYEPANKIMTFLLGPATVALAVPLYKNRAILLKNIVPAVVGILCGSFSTILVAVVILRLFHLSEELILSMTVKTVTVPIAVEVTKIIGGNPALSVVFVVATGFIGSMMGPWLMDVTRIKHPVARGLSLGTISHGQGTAQAAVEGELQGAVAGIAMGVSAVVTSIFVPLFIPYIV